MTIFELSRLEDYLDQGRVKRLKIFESGIQLYRNREWKEEKAYNQALGLFSGDVPSRLLSGENQGSPERSTFV